MPNRATPLAAADARADDIACARHVVQNAGKLSLLDPGEQTRILALAWRILQGHRPTRALTAKTEDQAARTVTSLALHKARLRIKARARARAEACATLPRRPRITVRPHDPSEPGDAA
jgi:hypothetical protein